MRKAKLKSFFKNLCRIQETSVTSRAVCVIDGERLSQSLNFRTYFPQTILIQLASEMQYFILNLILYLATWLQLKSQT